MKRTWYRNKHTGTIGYPRPLDEPGRFAIISVGRVVVTVSEWELKEHWERREVMRAEGLL